MYLFISNKNAINFYYSILINILYQSIILKIIKLLFIGWIFTFILKFENSIFNYCKPLSYKN